MCVRGSALNVAASPYRMLSRDNMLYGKSVSISAQQGSIIMYFSLSTKGYRRVLYCTVCTVSRCTRGAQQFYQRHNFFVIYKGALAFADLLSLAPYQFVHVSCVSIIVLQQKVSGAQHDNES